MKKTAVILFTTIIVTLLVAFDRKNTNEPAFIPASKQRTGDSTKGYEYLTTGDFLKSGIPYEFFIFAYGRGSNYLDRKGKSANVDHGYNVVTNADSMDIVIPTCLLCHADVFNGKLYVGLGNASADYSNIRQKNKGINMLRTWQLSAPKKYRAIRSLLQSYNTVNPEMQTEVRGVNPADRLTTLLVAHRDPRTLVWSDTTLLAIPPDVIPTDVPAWWLLKKKNAMFYNGFGRGDFTKFLMLSNILTVSDSSEAREVFNHFGDVLAYIRSLRPPPYPYPVDKELASQGKTVFMNNCRKCHGTYGSNTTYPNLLIPGSIIKTDSLLYKSNQQQTPFIDWFNKSWFAQQPYPARLEPGNGYVAPPLDGIWITAPYLHNGSVPTIEALLNSKLRPKYWRRDFDTTGYDSQQVGWLYQSYDQPGGKTVYNTTLPGYGNYGHYFGDKLSESERKAVIEYLKTL